MQPFIERKKEELNIFLDEKISAAFNVSMSMWRDGLSEHEAKQRMYALHKESLEKFSTALQEAYTQALKDVGEIVDDTLKTTEEFTGDGFISKDMRSFGLFVVKDIKIGLAKLHPLE